MVWSVAKSCNLGRWLQAVRRAQAARPDWFAENGEGKLAVGKGAGSVGVRAGLPAAGAAAAPSQEATEAAAGAAAAAATTVEPQAGGVGDDEAGGGTTEMEEDLFGNLDDL